MLFIINSKAECQKGKKDDLRYIHGNNRLYREPLDPRRDISQQACAKKKFYTKRNNVYLGTSVWLNLKKKPIPLNEIPKDSDKQKMHYQSKTIFISKNE